MTPFHEEEENLADSEGAEVSAAVAWEFRFDIKSTEENPFDLDFPFHSLVEKILDPWAESVDLELSGAPLQIHPGLWHFYWVLEHDDQTEETIDRRLAQKFWEMLDGFCKEHDYTLVGGWESLED